MRLVGINDLERFEKRMKIITVGQIYALSHRKKHIMGHAIAELWMIPLDAFSDDDVELFRQVEEYVDYTLGDLPEPVFIEGWEWGEDW